MPREPLWCTSQETPHLLPSACVSDAVCLAGQAVMVELGVHRTSNLRVQKGRGKLGFLGSAGEEEQGLQVPRRVWTPWL